jgi:hypothetical protein
MEPYRVPPPRNPWSDDASSPDYGHFEQACVYLLMLIAAAALAIAEIKIP